MGLSNCACLTAIVFCLTSIIVESFGDFILLRHPPDTNRRTRELTCLSENDDSALVWNYNFKTDETNGRNTIVSDFQPKKSGPKDVSNCAIWNSIKCIGDWEYSSQWDVVNSAKKPTNPVFDYRWEGFEEFVFGGITAKQEYVHMGNVEWYSETVVFSVRALRNVDIYLCEKENVEKSRCFRITIGLLYGKQSTIMTCDEEADRECKIIGEVRHETTVVDAYEWRTFRIEWKSEEQTVKIFKETEVKPFLRGIVQQWHSVSHIFVRSEISLRVRFHFYDYILTNKKNAELFTQQFYLKSEDLCVELLVGLCSNCQLKVSLIDESGHPIAENSISGNKDSANSPLLSWKPIKPIKILKRSMPKFVKLKVKTILNGSKDKGQWAVDSFRICKSDGSLRRSTITTLQEKVHPIMWPTVKCQKISYSESAIVDSLSKSKIIDHGTSRLLQLVRKSGMFDSYTKSRERWSICNPTGCACDRGYNGTDCATQCPGGFYGYDCNESCGSCYNRNCDLKNGRCKAGCKSDRLLPPFCTELEQPIFEDITETTARVVQKVKPESRAYIINFECIIRATPGGESVTTPTVIMGSTYTANFSNLRPGTTYMVYPLVNAKIGAKTTKIRIPGRTFTTASPRCFKAKPRKDSIVLSLNRDLEGCGALPVRGYYSEINSTGASTYSKGSGHPNLPFTYEELEPYSEYELTLYDAETRGRLWTQIVRTLPPAPKNVRYLHLPYLSDIKVILQWKAPLKVNGVITKYSVSIKMTTLLGCQDLGKPTPMQNATIKEVKDTIASFSGLNPYANYRAAVIAHTTEPGREELIEFQTLEADIPTSVVTNFEFVDDRKRLEWHKPEDCLTITGSTNLTRLVFTNISDLVSNRTIVIKTSHAYFDVDELNLVPYTSYNVRAYVLRSNEVIVNPHLYKENNWTTAPTAPSVVKSLRVYDADLDTNTVSLRWKPPNPANGDIESYHISIFEINTSLTYLNQTMEALDEKLICKLWKDFVCFENITLPPNVHSNFLATVSAKNKDVPTAGDAKSYYFKPTFDHKLVPASPQISRHKYQGHGIVTFKWKHPFSPIRITEFNINLRALKTDLWEKKNTKFSQQINYTFIQRRKEYSTDLHLETSTTYNISITSMYRNQFGGINTTRIEVPYEFGFIDGKKLRVDRNGTKINIKVPPIINGTRYTTVNVIVNGSLNCTEKQTKISSSVMNITELVLAEYSTNKSTPTNWTIDVNHINIDNLNCSLHVGKNYDIKVVVKALNDTTLATIACESFSLIDNDQTLLWFTAIIPIVAIFFISLFIWLRKSRRTNGQKSVANKFPKGASKSRSMVAFFTTKNWKLSSDPIRNEDSENAYSVLFATDSRVVTVDHFPEYIKTAASGGQLFSQYMMFPRDLTKPCEYGKLPQNMPKNRNEKQMPYDDTRVVLQKLPGDPDSDYINASYIQGHRGEKAYIATQDPLPNTVNDFWRMIWQEKVYVICMLTYVADDGQENYQQYWPAVGIKVRYGDVGVLITDLQIFADYTIRKFRLSCQKYKRKITHLHYTSWPDQGIPTYSRSLVAYLNVLMDTPTGNGPVVVHCSTGDGRTGTLILCDICLRQAIEEKVIDMTAVTTQMRKSRANMVGCSQQYLLAHIVITEIITASITQVACDENFSTGIKKLRKQLPNDIQRLNDTVWQERMLYSLVTPRPPAEGDFGRSELEKKLDSVCPDEIYFTRHSEPNSERSIYISAVSVDGVKTKKQYLASELPSKSTWSKFWILIAKQNVQLIIILERADPNDPTCCDIMPKKPTFAPVPHILVETKQPRQKEDHFTTEQLLLTDTSGDERRPQLVTVLTCTGWRQGRDGKPPNPAALVSLWLASNKIPRKEGISLVLCRNGVTRCGLYLALSFLLERMSVEKECDVISAVRAVRRFRPEFVQDLDDFEYLYDAAVNYIDCFATYANFT